MSKKKARQPIQHRQGDLFLEEVKELPADAVQRKDNIILYGEGTGHYHHIKGNAAVLERTDEIYISVKDTSELEHYAPPQERHGAFSVDPMIYKVIREREYDAYEGVRDVED